MKKLIYLLILSVTFALTGCTNKTLEIKEIKHDGKTCSVFSSEGFDKLDKDQIDTYIKHTGSFKVKFNQKVNECEVRVFLLDDLLNIHENHDIFGPAVNKDLNISWNSIEIKELYLGATFYIVDNFDFYDDKYCGIEIIADGETFYTAFKVMHYGKSLLNG